MSQNPVSGEYQSADPITVKASGAETTSTNGAAVFVGDKGTLRLDLTTTAATALTSLDVTLQTSADGSTWRAVNPVAAFAQRTGTGQTERKCFAGLDVYCRYVSVIVGTSVTYSIVGEAV